jgi:hypothetical protein
VAFQALVQGEAGGGAAVAGAAEADAHDTVVHTDQFDAAAMRTGELPGRSVEQVPHHGVQRGVACPIVGW